jgi:DNA-binding IclR family transcriptional regulator
MRTDIGTEKPALCTAEGMAILAFQPVELVERLLAGGVPARTPKTVTDPLKVHALLERIRDVGHAIDDEGSESGVRGVSAPIRDHRGNVIAAIGVAGPIQRLSKGPIQRLVPVVVSAAEAVSAAMGYRPGSLG